MQGPFWLPWRIILVDRENHIQNLLDVRFIDVRFLNVRFLFLSFAHTSAKTRIQRCLQLPMKFGDTVRVETSRY